MPNHEGNVLEAVQASLMDLEQTKTNVMESFQEEFEDSLEGEKDGLNKGEDENNLSP